MLYIYRSFHTNFIIRYNLQQNKMNSSLTIGLDEFEFSSYNGITIKNPGTNKSETHHDDNKNVQLLRAVRKLKTGQRVKFSDVLKYVCAECSFKTWKLNKGMVHSNETGHKRPRLHTTYVCKMSEDCRYETIEYESMQEHVSNH